MTATGLRPGQAWAIAPGVAWQARLCRAGRAHVIGRALALDLRYDDMYAEDRPDRWRNVGGGWTAIDRRVRLWHTFERACRAARMHERMVIAAKRNEGGDA